MSGKTTIEWCAQPGYAPAVWNPSVGCTRVSAGCDNCYAFALHDQRFKGQVAAAEIFFRSNDNSMRPERLVEVPGAAREQGAALPLPKQYDLPFSHVQLLPDRLDAPLRTRKPTCWFVDSMADLFHEDVPDEFIDRVWAAMALADRHRYLILTKRPERMREYVMRADFHRINVAARELTGRDIAVLPTQEHGMVGTSWPLANVWLGTSVEDQRAADERIPHLLATPAAVRFLSCEPLLGPVDLGVWIAEPGHAIVVCPGCKAQRWYGHGTCAKCGARPPATLDWVIVGGESGPRARPMDLAWARSLVEQCRAAGVAPFVKQLGSKPVNRSGDDGCPTNEAHDHPVRLSESHGRGMSDWPIDLRIREFPAASS